MIFNDAQIACHRFGLGAKPDEMNLVSKIGAKKHLLQQINNYEKTPALIAKLPNTITIVKEVMGKRDIMRKLKDKTKRAALQKQLREQIREVYLQGSLARHNQGVISEESFNERLVYFWQNHFAVSANGPNIRALAASFENEAIRKNVMGKFGDMLLAVARHPAMLLFLNNERSIGPNSNVGKRRKRGLNENLGREILELHTLGVDNGYSQQDIIALANMLTGWSVSEKSKTGFIFNKNTHEPNAAFFIGKSYNQRGVDQATAALKFLATHKNTAQYIAGKLAQHFAGETNTKLTQDLAKQLAESFIKTGGQLKDLYKIIINHSACWQPNNVRFKTPNEWVVSISRAAQFAEIEGRLLIGILRDMGQQTYMAGSPAGWPDFDKHWNSPSAFVQKWQVAKRIARVIENNPLEFTNIALGKDVDEHTLLAMRKTDNKNIALSLFLLSEQMQYR